MILEAAKQNALNVTSGIMSPLLNVNHKNNNLP